MVVQKMGHLISSVGEICITQKQVRMCFILIIMPTSIVSTICIWDHIKCINEYLYMRSDKDL